MVQCVQNRFTKRLPGFGHYNYPKRLQLLKLELFKVKEHLILCYKIVHGHVDIDNNNLCSFDTTSYTRGHDLKIVRKHPIVNALAFHFRNRVISHWNSLSY